MKLTILSAKTYNQKYPVVFRGGKFLIRDKVAEEIFPDKKYIKFAQDTAGDFYVLPGEEGDENCFMTASAGYYRYAQLHALYQVMNLEGKYHLLAIEPGMFKIVK